MTFLDTGGHAPAYTSASTVDRRAATCDGWARARALAAQLGGAVRDHLARGLRGAWDAARAAVAPQPELEPAAETAAAVASRALALPHLADALSRRAAIFGAVVVGAAPAVALARDALAANAGSSGIPHPDAELLALGRAWQASAERCNRARAALNAATERTAEVPIPEAILVRPDDDWRLLQLGFMRYDGRRWYPSPTAVRDLPEPVHVVAEVVTVAPWSPYESVLRRVREVDHEAVARRAEVVAAWDAYLSAVQAAEDASGYAVAEAEDGESSAENVDLRRRIMLLPALTLDGVAVKVGVAHWCLGGAAIMRSELGADDWPFGETLTYSLAADLVAMAERAA